MMKRKTNFWIFSLSVFSVIVFSIERVNAQSTESFEDPRDGKVYKTTKIGQQLWMAENIAHETDIGNYWAYDDDESNVDKYGYLYDWEAANNVCPPGWHLPSVDDWRILIDYVGSNYTTKLKAESGWAANENGTDDFGFSALPAGYRHEIGEFYLKGEVGHFWSSDENEFNQGILGIKFGYAPGPDFPKDSGFPVRCLKE